MPRDVARRRQRQRGAGLHGCTRARKCRTRGNGVAIGPGGGRSRVGEPLALHHERRDAGG
jgi:hypothetical protein